MKKALFYFLISVLTYFPSQSKVMNVSALISTVESTAKLGLDSYMVWCGNIIKGDENKYYLFYSRWPRSLGHLAWATDSEVAMVSTYKNGQLVKTAFVGDFNTRDATAARMVGTVGRDFESVGEVVMQVANADKESAAMKNFR
jgi:hypothetical protein